MTTRRKVNRWLTLLVTLALAGPLACRGSQEGTPPAGGPGASELQVTEIKVGRSVGADKEVAEETDSLAPSDTVYVSVVTEGSAPSATLVARWTYEDGQLVDESSQTISPSARAATEFHVSKPDGWPEGDYRVEILLNGKSAGSKNFKIESTS